MRAIAADAVEVRAAGGVVLRERTAGREVLVVHRPNHRDWSLPKGKLDRGEGWLEAALREVREETGLICSAGRELTAVTYRDRRGRSKLVRWWVMEPGAGEFEASDEVDEVRWVPVSDASEVLTYEADIRLVAEAVASA